MALDTRDKLVAAVAQGPVVPIYKSSIANMAAGYICSQWRSTGSYVWPQGAIPGAWATCDDNLLGGIVLPAFSSLNGYIVKYNPIGSLSGTHLLFDRLGHMGGLNGTLLTLQNVGSSLATASTAGRCAVNGSDVEWFIEVYTDVGLTAANATITYNDQTDTSRTVTLTGLFGASPLNRAGRCVQIIPNAGQSIKAVTGVTLSASTTVVGSFGVTACKRLTTIGQMVANIPPVGTDGISIGLPQIRETTCLHSCVICSTTSSGIVTGEIMYGII